MARMTLPLAAILLFAPVAAEATIFRAVELDEKVEHSSSIVVGQITRQEARWDAERKNILTYSTFRIEKTLKGQPAQEITIVTPGGTVGNVAQEIIGVPRFREGEEHVVFVRNTQAGPTVAYLEQGDYRVEKNARGERLAVPAVSSNVLVDTGRGTAVNVEAPRALRDFESAVQETVKRRAAMNRMELIERQKKEQASVWNQIQRNKLLVALAILGAVIASWQLVRRW
jgi:hypothetical protein